MNNILLVTYQNSVYKNFLIAQEYTVSEIYQPLSDNELDGMRSRYNEFDNLISIIEITDDNITQITRLLEVINYKTRKIFLCDTLSKAISSFLYSRGYPDLIIKPEPLHVINYLDIINQEHNANGSILVLDDNIAQIDIISSIIKRFNLDPIITNTLDEFFLKINDSGIQFILLNLGVKNFDLSKLIKWSYSNTILKRIPLVSYRSSSDLVLVNEIIMGLRKITRVILSVDEMYGFMLQLLFRNEFYGVMDAIMKSGEIDKMKSFLSGSIDRVYYNYGGDIFSLNNLLENNKFISRIDDFNVLFNKISGFKWMMIKPKRETIT